MKAAIEGLRPVYLYDRPIGPILTELARPLNLLVRSKVLTRTDLRTIHVLIAHGNAAPYTLLPLAA